MVLHKIELTLDDGIMMEVYRGDDGEVVVSGALQKYRILAVEPPTEAQRDEAAQVFIGIELFLIAHSDES